MLNIICLNAGNYLGKGVEYVNILANSVARNISKETVYKFICFTDTIGEYDPEIDVRSLPVDGLKGWWNKLSLFKEGLFPEDDRIIYVDLDTVITSALDEIIKYNGKFAILRDFYRPDNLQSAVMAWRSGFGNKIWQAYEVNNYPNLDGGDQEWIERYCELMLIKPVILQDIFPECFVSYKMQATYGIPKNAKIIIFHGRPRPHEINTGWMPYVWKLDGGTTLELKHICNTNDSQIASNVKSALKSSFPWLQMLPEHDGHAVIVGGGPSLKNDIEEIHERQKHGQVIFSTNNTYALLLKMGIIPEIHVMLDAREENIGFIPVKDALCYYASQVAPVCVEKASEGNKIVLWHPMIDGILEMIGTDTGDALVGGGTTVGMKSLALAFILGYRNFHLYGFDSSYSDGENHAYPQSLNDNDKIIEVVMNENKYNVAPWMATQVEDFKETAKALIEAGCIVTVHGSGLLPDVAKLMSIPDEPDTEMVYKDGIYWPSKCTESRLNTEFTFNDISTVISVCNGKKTAIQAGGNVGIWPREFSKHFEKVISFEPDSLNFECMVKNTENHDNLTIYNAALGDKAGSGALSRVSHNCGAHYIKSGDEFRVMTIDSLDLDSCDLIQLDVEGFELNALRGAQKTIDAFHPVIMVEDKGLSNRYGTIKGDIEKWLEPLGYTAHANTARDIIFVHR